MRTDQPKESGESLSILDKAIGKTMPPMLEPDTTMPSAAARFRWKYCDTAAKAETCSMDMPIPHSIPCASTNCQYSLQMEVIMRANTLITAPGRTTYSH